MTPKKNPEGLPVGNKIPDVESVELCSGSNINFLELAGQHRGVLINFFRANW